MIIILINVITLIFKREIWVRMRIINILLRKKLVMVILYIQQVVNYKLLLLQENLLSLGLFLSELQFLQYFLNLGAHNRLVSIIYIVLFGVANIVLVEACIRLHCVLHLLVLIVFVRVRVEILLVFVQFGLLLILIECFMQYFYVLSLHFWVLSF